MRIQARLSRQAQLLQTIPDVGPVTASAVAATIGSGHQFRSGREFAARLAEVGHIVLGRNNLLGRVLNLPSVRFVSHSRKGYDDFGNEILVKRGSTRKVDLSLLVPTHQAQRVMDIVAEVDGLATAFYLSGDGPGLVG
uniref:transposase n=1 Tax=Tritonibacter mobilis TaxID=379347 RepID=UPI000806A68D|nr:transposase [Tritonibacter mobilis]